jgi:hypothetical protein
MENLINVVMVVPNILPFQFDVTNMDQLHRIIDISHHYFINNMEPFVTYNYKITMFTENGPNHMIVLQPRMEGPDDIWRFLNAYVRFSCTRLSAHNGQYRNVLIAFRRATDESNL